MAIVDNGYMGGALAYAEAYVVIKEWNVAMNGYGEYQWFGSYNIYQWYVSDKSATVYSYKPSATSVASGTRMQEIIYYKSGEGWKTKGYVYMPGSKMIFRALGNTETEYIYENHRPLYLFSRDLQYIRTLPAGTAIYSDEAQAGSARPDLIHCKRYKVPGETLKTAEPDGGWGWVRTDCDVYGTWKGGFPIKHDLNL